MHLIVHKLSLLYMQIPKHNNNRTDIHINMMKLEKLIKLQVNENLQTSK